ncbi:MAG TPA: CPBP family intramembrane glutamic endopeptidase, partial [Cyclobacteriaceae bacterium]|nr:CPBP family intramembrane glutamic endopeptidase [Cyclobacteriaceae bacterium]
MTEPHQSLVSDKPPFTSLLLVFAVVFIGFVMIGPMIGFMLAMLIYEGDFVGELLKNSPDPKAFYPLMLVQGVASFIGLVLLPALYIRYVEQKTFAPFFRKEKNLPLIIGVICLLGINFVIAISPITEWNTTVEFPESLKAFGDWARAQEDKLAEMTRFLTRFDSFGAFLLGMLVIAVIPALGEEFVFRGLIQNELWRSGRNIHLAIWVSAFLFSAIHLQFFGFMPRFLLGALFGYLYYWSGNLLIPIIAHFFNNGFSLTLIYLQSLGISNIDMETETAAPLSWAVVCAVAVFALLYFFKRQYSSPPA